MNERDMHMHHECLSKSNKDALVVSLMRWRRKETRGGRGREARRKKKGMKKEIMLSAMAV